MRVIPYVSDQPLYPALHDIANKAGQGKVRFVKSRNGKGIHFGVETHTEVWTYSPKQLMSKSNVVSLLGSAIRLYLNPEERATLDVPYVVTTDLSALTGKTWIIDIETAGTLDGEPEDRPQLSIGIWDGNSNNPVHVIPGDQYPDNLGELLSSKNLIAHKSQFDLKDLNYWLGTKLRARHDTMVMHYALHSQAGAHGLKDLCRLYLGVDDWDRGVKEHTTRGKDYSHVPREQLYEYNAKDVYYTAMLWQYLNKRLKGQQRDFYENRMLKSHFLQGIEEGKGIHIDVPYFEQLDKEMSVELKEMLANLPINPNSPKQVKEFFGSNDSSEATLKKLVEEEHPKASVVQDILAFRKLKKLHATYVLGVLKRRKGDYIHPRFKVAATVTGRLASENPNCVDENTEVLTLRGWVPFPELLDGEKVYQVDPATGEGSFVIPSEVYRKNFSGELIEISATWGTFLYTANHRVPHYTKEEQLRWTTAENYLKWEGKEQIICRKLRTGTTKIDGIQLTEEELLSLKLAVLVQADGSYVPHRGGYYDVRVKSERKRKQLQELVGDRCEVIGDRLGIKVFPHEVSDWIICDKVKTFKDCILNLNKEALEEFIEQIFLWDGDSTRQQTFGQTGPRAASVDLVQAVATMIGYGTSRYHNPKNGIHTVNFTKPVRYQSRTMVSRVPYSGKVYCVTVPTGAFLIRRNGATLVTGNSQNVPRKSPIKKGFTAPPGYKVIAADYSQIEARVMAVLSGDENYRSAFQKDSPDFFDGLIPSMFPEDFPTYEDYYDFKYVQNGGNEKYYRTVAKGILYGLSYGRQAKAIGEATGLTEAKAQEVINNFFRAYPLMKEWRQSIFDRILNNELYALTGMKFEQEHYWPSPMAVSALNREALSFLPQHHANEAMLMGLIAFNEHLAQDPDPDIGWIHAVVHDEGLAYIKEDRAERYAKILSECLSQAAHDLLGYSVEFDADPEIKDSWEEE